MKVLIVYARLYAGCAARAGKGLVKNPWTLFLPVGLSIAFALLSAVLVSAIGPTIAGFIVGFVLAGAWSCYLYFLGRIVENARAQAAEFKVAIRTYFWSVVNVMFVIWIAQLISGSVLAHMENGEALSKALWLGVVILCNAAPEVIYIKGGYGGLATLQRSLQFLQENWIEWAIPNIALLALLYWVIRLPLPNIAVGALLGAVLHVGMVYRGCLFEALDGSSHRQRMFKYRNSL